MAQGKYIGLRHQRGVSLVLGAGQLGRILGTMPRHSRMGRHSVSEQHLIITEHAIIIFLLFIIIVNFFIKTAIPNIITRRSVKVIS